MSRTPFFAILAWLLLLSVGAADERKAVEMGNYFDALIRGGSPTVDSTTLTAAILDTARPLQAGEDPQPLTVVVIMTPQVNAMSSPGGRLFVTTGLLDVLRTRDELSAILAHELAHIELRHVEQTLSHDKKLRVLGRVLAGVTMGASFVVGGWLPSWGGMLAPINPLSPANLGASLSGHAIAAAGGRALQAMVLGHSHEQELEADRRAVKLLRAAGVDPINLVAVFERFRDLETLQNEREPGAISHLLPADTELNERLETVRKELNANAERTIQPE